MNRRDKTNYIYFWRLVVDPIQLHYAINSDEYEVTYNHQTVECPKCGKINMGKIVRAKNINITFEKNYHCPRCTYFYIDYGEGYSDGLMVHNDLEKLDNPHTDLILEYNENDNLTKESINSILSIKRELRNVRQETIRYKIYCDKNTKELKFHSEDYNHCFKPVSRKMAKVLLKRADIPIYGIDDEGHESMIHSIDRLDDFIRFAIDNI